MGLRRQPAATLSLVDRFVVLHVRRDRAAKLVTSLALLGRFLSALFQAITSLGPLVQCTRVTHSVAFVEYL